MTLLCKWSPCGMAIWLIHCPCPPQRLLWVLLLLTFLSGFSTLSLKTGKLIECIKKLLPSPVSFLFPTLFCGLISIFLGPWRLHSARRALPQLSQLSDHGFSQLVDHLAQACYLIATNCPPIWHLPFSSCKYQRTMRKSKSLFIPKLLYLISGHSWVLFSRSGETQHVWFPDLHLSSSFAITLVCKTCAVVMYDHFPSGQITGDINIPSAKDLNRVGWRHTCFPPHLKQQ